MLRARRCWPFNLSVDGKAYTRWDKYEQMITEMGNGVVAPAVDGSVGGNQTSERPGYGSNL